MRKKLLFALAICFLFSLFLYLIRTSSISTFFQGFVQEIFRGPKSALYGFASHIDAEVPHDALREENRKLYEQLAELHHLKKDNEALKNQFQETSVNSQDLLPAQIIGFQGSYTDPKMIVIDKGAKDRIREGSAVVVGKNLVGVVETVSARYSSIKLITHEDFSTVGKVSESMVLGVVKGAGNYILFDRVATAETVQKGDLILTRGDRDGEKGIMPDLIIGKVTSVNKVDSAPFQSAQLASLVDIVHLTKVFIVM